MFVFSPNPELSEPLRAQAEGKFLIAADFKAPGGRLLLCTLGQPVIWHIHRTQGWLCLGLYLNVLLATLWVVMRTVIIVLHYFLLRTFSLSCSFWFADGFWKESCLLPSFLLLEKHFIFCGSAQKPSCSAFLTLHELPSDLPTSNNPSNEKKNLFGFHEVKRFPFSLSNEVWATNSWINLYFGWIYAYISHIQVCGSSIGFLSTVARGNPRKLLLWKSYWCLRCYRTRILVRYEDNFRRGREK